MCVSDMHLPSLLLHHNTEEISFEWQPLFHQIYHEEYALRQAKIRMLDCKSPAMLLSPERWRNGKAVMIARYVR